MQLSKIVKISPQVENMKILAINGSPRKEGNSSAMLKSWVAGVKSAHSDAEIQWVDLYKLSSLQDAAAASPANAKTENSMGNVR